MEPTILTENFSCYINPLAICQLFYKLNLKQCLFTHFLLSTGSAVLGQGPDTSTRIGMLLEILLCLVHYFLGRRIQSRLLIFSSMNLFRLEICFSEIFVCRMLCVNCFSYWLDMRLRSFNLTLYRSPLAYKHRDTH